MKMRSTLTGNVQWEMPNGLIVSVGIGKGHYCDNKDTMMSFEPDDTDYTETMEVAVFTQGHYKGSWWTKKVWMALFGEELYDDVAGHVSVDQLPNILAHVSAMDLIILDEV
jgi:hypothetical protein